jgi:hypothetical protein
MRHSLPATDPAVLDPSTSGLTVFVSPPLCGGTFPLAILQLSWNAHSVAVIGIIALAILGGVLVARNRLSDGGSIASDPDPNQHEEFVTDQEQVRRLLSENGGRMKQSNIVDSVDWSKAKVSRLLAELEEDDQITKLRLGRENLVCLPGYEPTASKSPEQPKNE